ncbi:MAG: hypothetical protein ACRDIZ_08595 [Actinomycetota bacterium]
MAWQEIQNPESVLRAVQEFDRLGRDTFLEKYHFGKAYNYFLVIDRRLYDSKAVLGVAHGYEFPDKGPLRGAQFSGGQATVKRKLEELGFDVRVLTGVEAGTTAYWWQGQREERYWVEIRRVLEGLGYELRCPFIDSGGRSNPWYDLVDALGEGQIVYHWNAVWERFVGRSVVAASRSIDSETGERIVPLRDFTPLRVEVGLEELKELRPELEARREQLASKHPGQPLYVPFQFRSDDLRLMSNYFTKLPDVFQRLLFGTDGLAESELPAPPAEEGPPETPASTGVRAHYLRPFKRKADSHYLARIEGGLRRRGRHHETLVNDFARWLQDRGHLVGRNAAIDLGLEQPPVIIEAKSVSSWARAIREAVGQLYEYRYFQVVSPESQLVFLASQPVPGLWLRYLEDDRGIGAAWRVGNNFEISPRARAALELG